MSLTNTTPKRSKSGVLTDEEILTRVDNKSKESVGWYDSKISKERERVLKYYNGELPRRANLGQSSFVSTDVYDAVEGMKAQTLEVFAGGDEIAQFDADQDMGVADCIVATKYASYVIFSKNLGFQVFNNVIHDGLTARVGVCKVWWDEKFDYEEESFDGLTLDQVHGLASQDEVDELDADHDEATGAYKGKLVRKYDKSQVRILEVPPEEFLIEPRAISIRRAGYCAHRTLKTKAELKEMGLDAKKVDAIHYDDAKGLDLSPEVLARNAPVETLQALDNPIQPELEKVMLYESYVTMVIDKSKGSRLYKVVHASTTLFDYEEVDRAPFIVFVPLPIPHLFYGNNFAHRVVPIQNARTVLARAILDHTAMTVTPRWGVVQGGLLNPREMLDNRMGGIVNMRRPDSVAALQVPNLNPFVFQTMQELEMANEKSTGLSSLSQGLNKDAISKQNSRGLVNDLVNLASTRQKVIARQFAYGFFQELMLEVIRLAIANKAQKEMIEVAGAPMQVDPTTWKERKTCTVSMHLGYGEKEQQLGKLTNAYQMFSADADLKMAGMFTPQNKYNMLRDGMKLAGLTNAPNYLTAPDKAKPLPPDPKPDKELQIKDKTATAALISAQAQMAKDQRLAQLDETKLNMQKVDMLHKAQVADRDANRHDLEVAARIKTAEQELALQKKATEQKAILAPNP